MKIALTSEFFPHSSDCEIRGGVEARAFHVARHLAENNDVTVYTILEKGLEPEAEFDGIKVVRVKPEVQYSQASSLSKRFVFMFNGLREIRGESFELVDGSSFMTYPLAWHSGMPNRIATYHDVWVGEWVRNIGASGVFGEVLERYVLSRRWDKYIAVSEYTKSKLVKNGVNPGDVAVIHNGVDLKQCRDIKAGKKREPTICCVSRLVKYKHVDDLINAMQAVKEEFPDTRLVIVGTGPEEQNLKDLAAGKGLEDCVEFKGFIPEHRKVLETMKSSNILCHPSTVEGFGITLVEAMALKVPYVASDIPPLREASRDGAGGILFTPLDVDDLASKLKAALRGEVKAGASFIGEYDWRNIAGRVEEVYRRVVEG